MTATRFLASSSIRVALLVACSIGAVDAPAQSLTFTHLAGSTGGPGWFDGTGSEARFSQPGGVAVDGAGNIYVADRGNHTIRKISPSGSVTTMAGLAAATGSAGGTGNEARFNSPTGVTVDVSGNVYVADTENHTVRKVSRSGSVTTLAGESGSPGSTDGMGSGARFSKPAAVAVDGSGNVYVADTENFTIRKITPSGSVTTLAGLAGSRGSADGLASGARFSSPSGVSVDESGNVYVADRGNHTIRKVTASGVVTTLAGVAGSRGSADGTGSEARFAYPSGVVVDSEGGIYVSDGSNYTIRKVTSSGVVTTLAGLAGSRGSADGTGTAARFSHESSVSVGALGNVYVADRWNHTIRRVTPSGGVTTLAGMAGASGSADGSGSGARFNGLSGVTTDGSGNAYVADVNSSTIRKVDPAGIVTTLAGSAGSAGFSDGTGSGALFAWPSGVAADGVGNVYVADTFSYTIRRVTPAGIVTTLAGLPGSYGSADGMGSEARFSDPSGVAVDSAGNIYVADFQNHTIRKVTSSGVVTTLAGLAGNPGSADGTGSEARFSYPSSVTVDGAENVYVADYENHTIRRVTAGGVVTTLAGLAGSPGSTNGMGSGALFHHPIGVAVDGWGNVYVADLVNRTIRKVTASGVVTTLAGLAATSGSADGTGSNAQFSAPGGVAVDGAGLVFVADSNALRRGSPALSDVATIDASTGPIGSSRLLGSSPQTASSWLWEVVRRPVDSTAPLWATDIAAPYFQPDRPGLYTFRLTATASNGQQSITTVDLTATCVSPTATVSGSTTICPGSGANLLVDLTGLPPWTLTWSDGTVQSDLYSTPAYRTVYPTTSDTYWLTSVTGATCAGSTSGSATVTVAATPGVPSISYASGASPTCPGASITLDAGAGYDGYSWSTGATTRTITISPTVTTTYSVQVRIGSCWSPWASRTHYVDLPFATPTLTLQHGSATMCSGALGGRVALAVTGGYQPLYRWGYRIVPGGATTWITGFSSSPYIDLQALSFPGTGTFFLVGQALSQGGCAGIATSGEFAVVVKPCAVPPERLNFTHLAGSYGGPGWFDGTANAARFSSPISVALDSAGNVYVADANNYTIRKATTFGAVTTLAGLAGAVGYADGTGSSARFFFPRGVAVDEVGNVLIADGNHTIRRVTPAGVVSTVAGVAGSPGSADGTGIGARFRMPWGLAVDRMGNVFVADAGNNTIRRVTVSGVVTTLAGFAGASGSADGSGTSARFSSPRGLALDEAGNIYVTDWGNHTIRKVTASGLVTTLAGLPGESGSVDGTGGGARFSHPSGLAVDGSGAIWVADGSNHTIRRVTTSGVVTTIAGSAGLNGSEDGTGASARFYGPAGVAVDRSGSVYVADYWNDTIRKMTTSGSVTTFAGLPGSNGSSDGTGSGASFYLPGGIDVDGTGTAYVAERDSCKIRKVTSSGMVTTLAGAGHQGSADGTATAARFSLPRDVAVDSAGNVYVADQYNHTIRRVTSSGVVTTLAGLAGSPGSADGAGGEARFDTPSGVAVDGAGNVYVADQYNHTIRRVTSSGVVTTLAGLAGSPGSADGSGGGVRFSYPTDVAVDGAGIVYVADEGNSTVRRVSPYGEATTLAGQAGSVGHTDGTGSGARFANPNGVAVDGVGNVYVADWGNHTIRRVTASGVVSTVAGFASNSGKLDGAGMFARFHSPIGVAVDGTGNVLVSDYENAAIRKGSAALLDTATIDSPSAPAGALRILGSSPQTASSWLWEVVRRPADSTAPLSSTTAASPTFIPDRDGLFTFRLTATASNGQQSITLVDFAATCGSVPTPVVSSSANPSCPGSPVTLDAGAGYTSYLWSTGETTRTITVAPTVTQSYTVTGYVGSCPSTQVAYLQLVFGTPSHPSPSSNSPICAGGTLALYAAGTSGATYLWSGPNGFASTLQNPTIPGATAAASGVYTVTVTAAGCSRSASTTVVVSPIGPVAIAAPAAANPLAAGLTASVPDAGAGATYAWTVTNGSISGGQGTRTLTFRAGSSGTTQVGIAVTRPGGCVSNGEARVAIVTAPVSGGPGSTLFLPLWEVSANGTTGGNIPPVGTDTVVSWANQSGGNVVTHVTLWNRRGKPVLTFNVPLRGGDVVEMSLREALNGLLNVNPAVQQADPRGDPCKQPEWIRFSNPDPSDRANAVCFYATPAYGGTFRARVWDSLDDTPNDPACQGTSPSIANPAVFRGSLTIDVVNYATNFFPTQASFLTNDALATAWPDGSVNVLEGTAFRWVESALSEAYPMETLRYDSGLDWASAGSTFYSAFQTSLDTGFPVTGVPAEYAFRGDGRTPVSGQPGTIRLSASSTRGSQSATNTVTFEALVNPTAGACGGFSCQLELVSGPPGGEATVSYGVVAANPFDGIARWTVQLPPGLPLTDFQARPFLCGACATCVSNRISWTSEEASSYFTLTPCRVVNTRRPDYGLLGAPSIEPAGSWDRPFVLGRSPCGIPATAKAVALNVTVAETGGAGYLTLYPGDEAAAPATSTINFSAGQVKANNLILPLSKQGTGTIRVRSGATAPLNMLVDVVGYFE